MSRVTSECVRQTPPIPASYNKSRLRCKERWSCFCLEHTANQSLLPINVTCGQMTTRTTAPRVLVRIKATATCYLSNYPPFYLILEWDLCNTKEQPFFLEDGFAGARDFQPINSNHVIQCFDDETGEQVHVVDQGTQPVVFDRGAVYFTSCDTRQTGELACLTSSLRAGRRYRLRFRPTTCISHWSGSAECQS
jgi:hypothetical protein